MKLQEGSPLPCVALSGRSSHDLTLGTVRVELPGEQSKGYGWLWMAGYGGRTSSEPFSTIFHHFPPSSTIFHHFPSNWRTGLADFSLCDCRILSGLMLPKTINEPDPFNAGVPAPEAAINVPWRRSVKILQMSASGWWFQTFGLFSIISGIILSHWLSYFSRWLKPPTSHSIADIDTAADCAFVLAKVDRVEVSPERATQPRRRVLCRHLWNVDDLAHMPW